MKKIEAIIKPINLDRVRDALDEIGVDEMTISEVRGFGRRKAHAEIFRGTEFPVGFLQEIKIELVLPDGRGDAAIAAIMKGIGPGNVSQGRVFVSQIDEAGCGRTDKLNAQAA
jgi:nitrogen regulatory protein P-II 1